MRCRSITRAGLIAALAWLAACGAALTEYDDVVVRGRVVDARLGIGLGDVRVAAGRLSVYSDYDGSFRLEGRLVEPEPVTFRFTKRGYADAVTQAVVAELESDVGTVALWRVD